MPIDKSEYLERNTPIKKTDSNDICGSRINLDCYLLSELSFENENCLEFCAKSKESQ